VSTVDPAAYADLVDALTAIAMAAATAIGDTRGKGGVRAKADGSPVTAADRAAEAVIRDGLARLIPTLPIISEEAAERQKPAVKSGGYFLVDPLDGTREFIAGRDEYTINIALVADGAPALGVIAAPALGMIWRGIVGRGADRLEFSGLKAGAPEVIETRARPEDELIVIVSRSHLDPRTQAYVDGLPPAQRLASGSSIKFCRLAEGAADLYPRLAPTHDWDVGAGHAILAAAGGSVIEPDGAALTYGSPDLIIPAFIAWGGPAPADGAIKG
jgi:3'(2'), 5'-bisphosphate nucleotidase